MKNRLRESFEKSGRKGGPKMGEVYHEFMIKQKITMTGIMLRVFSIALCIGGIYTLFLIGSLGVIIECLLIYLSTWIFKRTDVEIEYCYLSGECQFDKIFSRSKRKGCGKLEVNKMEIMALEGSKELDSFEKENYRVRNFSSLEKNARKYVAFVRKDSELIKVIFEPNDEILESMQMMAPRKVLISKENITENLETKKI